MIRTALTLILVILSTAALAQSPAQYGWFRGGTGIPPVDVQMNPQNNAPAIQPAHNGRYRALSNAPLPLLDMRTNNGLTQITLLLEDGSWLQGSFAPAGRAQVLFDLRDASGAVVGQMKIGTLATTGSPPPRQAKQGAPCARVIARARMGSQLLFPWDPNTDCSTGPGVPGTYCRVQVFAHKLGEAGNGPETCQL